jgi:ATP-dependent exoDNAse (exonuclease V) beta subunit
LAAAKFRLAHAERQRLTEQLDKCLTKPLGGLLASNRYGERGGRPVVLREWAFAVDGDRAGAALHGRIDRLVVGIDEAGRPIWAEIIDYKVQLVPSGEAAAAEEHRPQMDAYREAVAAMFKLDAQAVRCVVAFPLIGTFAELPRSNPEGRSADKEVRATQQRSDGAKKK